METWRLIQEDPKSGSYNMAADQVLLENVFPTTSPVLRLYGWDSWTLSIGQNQQVEGTIDWDWCHRHGVSVVRRMTGGKAVLHGRDITYALVASNQDSRFCHGILETYRKISEGFLLFFNQLGLQPAIHETPSRLREGSPICFSVPSVFEILIHGRKIIGSAQRQTKNGFLQHGTIPVQDPSMMLRSIFKSEENLPLDQQMTSLEAEGVFPRITMNALQSQLIQSIEKTFSVKCQKQDWTPDELSQIAIKSDQVERICLPFNRDQDSDERLSNTMA